MSEDGGPGGFAGILRRAFARRSRALSVSKASVMRSLLVYNIFKGLAYPWSYFERLRVIFNSHWFVL